MQTLIINPPSGSTICKSFTMPLGVCSLKAYLKQNSQIASVVDLNIKTFLNSEKKYLWEDSSLKYWLYKDLFYHKVLPAININKSVDQILQYKADIIGFSVNAASIHSSMILVSAIKKQSDAKIIFGGALCHHDNAEMFLRNGVDAVVIGEGEETLLDLVSDFKLCKATYMIENNKLVYGGTRALIDVNTLPYPDFEDIIDDYRNFSSGVWLSTSFVRGCNNRCAFCEESPFWQKARQKSPQKIIEELSHLTKTYNTKFFHKGDSILATSGKIMNEICELIIKRNLELQWFSQARLEKWLTKDLLLKMKQAGCSDLSFGAESGSQKVLDWMNKNANVTESIRIIKDAHNAGINVNITLMVGAPKENLIDFFKTIRFILKTRKYLSYFMISTAMLLPRSDWNLNPEKYGIKKNTKSFRKSYATNRTSTLIKRKILEILRFVLSIFYKHYAKGGEGSLSNITDLMKT